MNKNALILFVKTPIPGFSKTRLSKAISAEKAAEFYSASLKDVYHTMQDGSQFDLFVAIAPEKYNKKNFPLTLKSGTYFFQEGEDLGIRMRKAIQFVFGKGYEKAAIIGSDFPNISENIIQTAFVNLNNYDCVLGPAEDGGYYLIALNKLIDTIFEGIDWSTAKVYNQTHEKAEKNNIIIKDLKMHYDVDTVKEIKQLYVDLDKMEPSLKNFPLNVWQFLQKNKNTFL